LFIVVFSLCKNGALTENPGHLNVSLAQFDTEQVENSEEKAIHGRCQGLEQNAQKLGKPAQRQRQDSAQHHLQIKARYQSAKQRTDEFARTRGLDPFGRNIRGCESLDLLFGVAKGKLNTSTELCDCQKNRLHFSYGSRLDDRRLAEILHQIDIGIAEIYTRHTRFVTQHYRVAAWSVRAAYTFQLRLGAGYIDENGHMDICQIRNNAFTANIQRQKEAHLRRAHQCACPSNSEEGGVLRRLPNSDVQFESQKAGQLYS